MPRSRAIIASLDGQGGMARRPASLNDLKGIFHFVNNNFKFNLNKIQSRRTVF